MARILNSIQTSNFIVTCPSIVHVINQLIVSVYKDHRILKVLK